MRFIVHNVWWLSDIEQLNLLNIENLAYFDFSYFLNKICRSIRRCIDVRRRRNGSNGRCVDGPEYVWDILSDRLLFSHRIYGLLLWIPISPVVLRQITR